MNNILVTGGAGFIGSNLVLRMVEKGYTVTVLDNLSTQIHGKDYNKSHLFNSIRDKVKFIKGSVSIREDLIKAIMNQDAIIHLAAETGTGQSMYEIEKYSKTNILGTAILLDILTNEKHTIKKVLVASSRAIYGEGKYRCKKHGFVYPAERQDDDIGKKDFSIKCPKCNTSVELCATDEESLIHPSSIYGISKQVQEQMVHCVCKAIGIPSVSFRYQNVYGPGQSLKNPYTGILSIFSNLLRQNKDVLIFEDGKESRDFIFIDDVVSATLLGLESDYASYKEFNIGTGFSVDVLTVANLLKKNYKSSSSIKINGNYRKGDIRHNFADISKAKQILGFSAMVPFTEGLDKFCKWVVTQPLEEDNYRRSLEEMRKKGLYR